MREIISKEAGSGGTGAVGQACRVLFGVIAILASMAAVVPIPRIADWGAEVWWPVALQVAFLNRLEAGREVVFTYGPLGFLAEGYHPDTYTTVLAVRAVIVVVILAALWAAAREGAPGEHRGSLSVLVLLGLIPFVVSFALTSSFFLWFPFLLLSVGLSRRETAKGATGALLVIAGLLSLVKFSQTVMLVVVVGTLTLEDMARRRRPWALVVWFLSFIAFWVASGQSVRSIPSWIASSLEIATGYNASQGRDRDVFGVHPSSLLFGFVICAVVFLATSAWIEKRRSALHGALHLVGWGTLAYLTAKSGFVRADEWHVSPAIGALLLAAVTWMTFSRRGERSEVAATSIVVASLVGMVALLDASTAGGILRSLPSAAGRIVGNAVEVLDPKTLRWMREEEWRVAIDAENRSGKLPIPAGSVDSYPSPVGAVFQGEARYAPRPVLRSTDTYSPALALRNQEHLCSSPPAFVLFAIDPKDGRFPPLEEGESWPLLWTRYVVSSRHGETLLLSRRRSPEPYELVEIHRVEGLLGQDIDVPVVDGPLFASFEVEPTVTGRIRSFLLRGEHLTIGVQRFDGTSRLFRFVPLMAEKPVLVSPLVDEVGEFASVASGGDVGAGASRTRAVRLAHAPGRARLWTGRVAVTFYRMESPELFPATSPR